MSVLDLVLFNIVSKWSKPLTSSMLDDGLLAWEDLNAPHEAILIA